MNVVELFAGIGGFRIACDRVGLKTVWANDISPAAASVYRAKFGNVNFHEGDIKQLLLGIPGHDVLTGGFPCQPFSAAGKKMGVEDPRGTLFQVIVDILSAHKPKHFVLENVKRLLTMDHGRHFATILHALAALNYEIEWRLLNACDLGLPQNRQRVIIIGTLGAKGAPRTRLTDHRELSEVLHVARANTDLGSWSSIVDSSRPFPSWGIARNGRFIGVDVPFISDLKPIRKLRDTLQAPNEVGAQFDFTEGMAHRLIGNEMVERFIGGVEVLSNQSGGARMGYTVYGINGVAPTLTASQSRHYERYMIGNRYRRLTNVEYARIQGFPDDHCAAVSPMKQYMLFGNAVPPAMVEWALTKIFSEGELLEKCLAKPRQEILFADV